MITQADAVKTFKTRDSATSLLRKLGIKPRDYNLFIEKAGDSYVCQVARAQMHLKSLEAPKPAAKTNGSAQPRRSLAAEFRQLIAEGRTNQEVWAVMSAKHGLDDSKKHYPGWYRAEMTRKGLL